MQPVSHGMRHALRSCTAGYTDGIETRGSRTSDDATSTVFSQRRNVVGPKYVTQPSGRPGQRSRRRWNATAQRTTRDSHTRRTGQRSSRATPPLPWRRIRPLRQTIQLPWQTLPDTNVERTILHHRYLSTCTVLLSW